MKIHLRTRPSKNGPVYYLDYYIDKARKRETLNVPFTLPPKLRKARADKLFYKRQFEINQKMGVIEVDILLADLLDQYLSDYKKKDYRKVKNGCDAFLAIVPGDTKITKVTSHDCKSFKEYMVGKYATDTVSSYFKSVKKIFTYAVDKEYLISNPFRRVKNVSSKNEVSKEVPTKEDYDKLVESECPSPEVKRAYLFCCNTGLGNTDCRLLDYSQIKEGFITGLRGKGRSNEVPLNEFAISLLGSGEGKVFNMPSDSYLSRAMKEWTKTAEVDKHLTFYTARHYLATQLVIKEVPLPTIIGILGHSSLKYIMRYVKVSRAQKMEAVSKLDQRRNNSAE